MAYMPVGPVAGGGQPYTTPGSQNYDPTKLQWQQPVGEAPGGYTFDPVTGKYAQTAGSPSDVLAQRKRQQGMQDTLFGQEQTMFGKAMEGLSGFGGGGGQMPSLQNLPQMPSLAAPPGGAGGGVNQVTQIQPPDMGPAQQAAFGRAKDQQGEISRSALSGLQGSLAGRGMLGSGQEGRGTRQVVQQGAEALGNLTREQAITQADQAQKTAEMAYQGGITQRGQDIGQQESARDAALRQWQAQTQGQLGQGQLGLQAFQVGNQAALDRQRLALEQSGQFQNALSGLSKSLY